MQGLLGLAGPAPLKRAVHELRRAAFLGLAKTAGHKQACCYVVFAKPCSPVSPAVSSGCGLCSLGSATL